MAEKKVVWEGDSLEKLKDIPDAVKQDLGSELRRLQLDELPLDSRPMKSIAQGVFELRGADGKSWYRVIYYIKIKETIYVLHSFIKKSNKTSKRNLSTATKRLKNLINRVKQETKNGKDTTE